MMIRILLLSILVLMDTAHAAVASLQTPRSLTTSPSTPRKATAQGLRSLPDLSTIQESFMGSNNNSYIPSDDITKAAFDNDIVQVTRLLKQNIDPNTRNSDDSTALHRTEYSLMTELLLEHGAHPNITNTNGDTPLHYASNKYQVKALVKHGALCTKNNDGNTPLHLVGHIKNGDRVIPLLLEAQASLFHRNKQHRTPLEETVIIFVNKLTATGLPETETTAKEILATIQAFIGLSTPINRTSKQSKAALALLLKETKSLQLTKKQKLLVEKAETVLNTPHLHTLLLNTESTDL